MGKSGTPAAPRRRPAPTPPSPSAPRPRGPRTRRWRPAPHRDTELEDSVASTAIAADTGLLVEPSNGALRIVDPLIAARQRAWTVAEAPNVTYLQPAIAADGSFLIAIAAGHLLRWYLPSSRSQAETMAWLGTLTNVTSEVLQPPR